MNDFWVGLWIGIVISDVLVAFVRPFYPKWYAAALDRAGAALLGWVKARVE